MIKRARRKPEPTRFYRKNERIAASTLRVIGDDGKQIGVLGKFEALQKARELGLDLVEVAPMAKPPVAKIIDFNKFLYQEAKKRQEEKKKSRKSETKEIRLGPFMDDHDLQVMINRAREFIQNGDKVRIVVKFRGRQIVHPEFGQETLKKVTSAIADVSKIERDPHFEGKQLLALIVPDKRSVKAKVATNDKGKNTNESKKISQQTV